MVKTDSINKVLIIKTSSLGDVIHTLPAVTDAMIALPQLKIDWVVEEAFAEIPAMHPGIQTVIPIALRRWRKSLWQTIRNHQWADFKEKVGENSYQTIIDAQGLLKSAFITRYTHGPVMGLDKSSVREPMAARFYDKAISIKKNQHAISRVRQLFAQSLGYPLSNHFNGYGLAVEHERLPDTTHPYVMFFHGTTWISKLWSEQHWSCLAMLLIQQGYRIKLTWGNAAECQRAESIKVLSGMAEHIDILPKLSLVELTDCIRQCSGVVSVDSGLGHLAAALEKPMVALYGPTEQKLTGCYGSKCINLMSNNYTCMPCLDRVCILDNTKKMAKISDCMQALSPQHVLETLLNLITPNRYPLTLENS